MLEQKVQVGQLLPTGLYDLSLVNRKGKLLKNGRYTEMKYARAGTDESPAQLNL
jgi:hypothetical protein